MRYRDLIDLVSTEKSQNENGYPVVIETARQVFASAESVKRSEFYAGNKEGIQLAIAFVVRCADYSGETLIDYDGKRYRLIRSYTKDGEWLELNCAEVVV